MKNVKLSLFVLALTLAVAIPSGVKACEKGEANVTTKNSVEQKIDFRTQKNEEWGIKFKKNHKNNEKCDSKIAFKDAKNKEWCVKYQKNHENKVKCGEVKIALTADQKAALQAKEAAIEKLAADNKVLEAKICADKEAVKAELVRIKLAGLVLTTEVQAQVDEVIPPEVVVAPTPVEPVVEVIPVVAPVVDPEAEVTPVVAPVVPKVISEVVPVVVPTPVVEQTYFEKVQAKLNNVIADLTAENTKLAELSAKILSLLDALNFIK